jgi:hypothetical protein
MSWIECLLGNGYEIFDQYPFYIRKKSNGRIIKESVMNNGYVQVTLNGVHYLKHRIIATHFLPNDLPLIKTDVDHINHDRSDYRLENLRWVSHKENLQNKSSFKGIEYEYIEYDDMPDDLVEVRDYGKHEFEDYYYSSDNNRFYFDTGINLRVLHINFKKNGSAFVNVISTEGKQVQIMFTKFKKLYGFD